MTSQFETPAARIEPDYFYPVRFQKFLSNLWRAKHKLANEQGTLSVANIADKRSQYGAVARIHCSIEVMHDSGKGRRTSESFSFDLSDSAVDEIIAELQAHRAQATP